MEVLDLAGQPADLGRERRRAARAAARGSLSMRPSEGVAMEDERLGRLERDDRRRVRRAVEQRQLAEELARAEGRDDRRLGALVARAATILTEPLARMNSASPGSPWWKIVSPRRKRRTRRARDERVDRRVVAGRRTGRRPQGLADAVVAMSPSGRPCVRIVRATAARHGGHRRAGVLR